jgi:hypothetical protein
MHPRKPVRFGQGIRLFSGAILAVWGGLAVWAQPAAAPQPEWQNETLVHAGTEAPFATMTVFPDEATARTLARENSPRVASLNGDWKIFWVPKPADRVADFWRPDFNDAAWKTIPVPSNVEVQGFGMPIYTNITYPWKVANPPLIPDDYNPVSAFPAHLYRAGRLAGPGGLPDVRRRELVFLPLAQRPETRLQQGQPHARHLPDHAASPAGPESPRGGGLPLERRLLSRRSGFLAAERHLPQCHALVARPPCMCAISRCRPGSTPRIATRNSC